MLFNSIDFLIFFFIVYSLYLILDRRGQNFLLLVAGIVFYGYWDWRFLSLIFFSICADFFFGIKIAGTSDREAKKKYITGSILVNLTLLGIFKYYNFFAANIVVLAARFGISLDWITLNVILPIGISFYTFQSLSYTIDIYRNRMPPERNFFTFATFVLFFPQLLAGPIERAIALLPQLEKKRTIGPHDIKMATWLILWGFYLKIFVADNLAFAVNDVYSSGGSKNPLEIILGTYAFAFQIFGDFAGYSSIAIGIARLMGFKLMTNFLFPYFVTNSQDFWRNWHISLSSWLRDYLYISLGGSRHGPRQTYRNLFLTMFLGGIWHGAAWPYFIWGTFQGCALIIHRLFESGASQFRKTSAASSDSFLFLRIFLMFQITCIGWLVFRANSLEQIETMSHSLVFGEYQPTTKSTALLKQIIFFAAPLMLIQFYNWKHNNQFAVLDLNNAKKILLSLFLIYSIVFWGEFGAQQFIYFQF